MTFHELSDQLFDVREKLSSDEYNKMYNLLMKLERQDSEGSEGSEDIGEVGLEDESYVGLWKLLFELIFDDCVKILRGFISPISPCYRDH